MSYCRDYKLDLPSVWSIEFKPLAEITEKDEADIELKEAQAQKARADAVVELLEAQVLDGIEARDTLEKEYKLDRSLDGALQRNGNE